MSDVVSDIKRAKAASIELSVLSTEVKDRALSAMAQALDSSREQILEANARDLEAAKAMLDSGEISGSMYKRLKIDGSKIDGMIAGIDDVIGLADPVGEQMSALDLDDGLTLYQIRCPIGMLGMIFESRPDVVPQIMSLCLKSGNAVAFKGGREAANSGFQRVRPLHPGEHEDPGSRACGRSVPCIRRRVRRPGHGRDCRA